MSNDTDAPKPETNEVPMNKSVNGAAETAKPEVHEGEIVEAAAKAKTPAKSGGLAKSTKKETAISKVSEAAKSYQITPLPNNRPIFPSQFQYVDSDTLPNHRPVAVRSFEVVALLPGGRPIAQKTFDIVALLPGDRPISAPQFDYVDSDTLPGHRPIALHTFEYDKEHLLPGNRPIAVTNVDKNIKTLIGYLD